MLSPFRMVCGDFILPESANYVSLFCFLNLRNLLYLIEKLEREKYVVERKLTAAMHKEKRLQSELKRLTRSERTHRLCTRAGMLETFLKEPTTLTDDDVMELLTFIFHSEAVQKKLDLLIANRKELGQPNGS